MWVTPISSATFSNTTSIGLLSGRSISRVINIFRSRNSARPYPRWTDGTWLLLIQRLLSRRSRQMVEERSYSMSSVIGSFQLISIWIATTVNTCWRFEQWYGELNFIILSSWYRQHCVFHRWESLQLLDFSRISIAIRSEVLRKGG